MHKNQQKLSYKKRLVINSLEAAICNVALFKSMKDKQFKDSIFISYCEDGVILQANSEGEWKRAHEHVRNFLDNRRISQLTYGYDKEEYEELINKGLKQYTRRIKEKNEECPYINIIHYQKLRKSCEYMDKQKYVQPLKDWEKKSKKSPNFAFLIVEPKSKYNQVKRSLLQCLMNKPISLNIKVLDPFYFLYMFFKSPLKEKVKEAHNKKLLDICVKESEDRIEVSNFTEIDLEQYSYSIIDGNKNINKWGLDYISAKQLREQMKNAKLYCRQNPLSLLEKIDGCMIKKHQQNYSLIPYKSREEEKYKMMIQKFSNLGLSKEEILRKVEKNVNFNLQDIEFISLISKNKLYKTSKVCINNCPFMVHEYNASQIDIDAFLIYLEQLGLYYCTYLVRFYGLAIKYKPISGQIMKQKQIREIQKFYLVFDYHKSTLSHMLENDMILDNMQIGTMMLQLLYLLKFLHHHQQPRCLGIANLNQIFWPMCTALPYLGATEQQHGLEGDVKQVAELMRDLMKDDESKEGEDEFETILNEMLSDNKYDRPSTEKCIDEFEEILCL